jgi:hypothetical protein
MAPLLRPSCIFNPDNQQPEGRQLQLSTGQRAGRLTVGGLVWALLMTLAIACERNAWADGSGQAAPGNSSAAPAASSSPTPAAASTPVPPLSSPTIVGPLQMASPNEVDLPKLVPRLSEIPSPIVDLLKFDVNGVVSGIGIVQPRRTR